MRQATWRTSFLKNDTMTTSPTRFGWLLLGMLAVAILDGVGCRSRSTAVTPAQPTQQTSATPLEVVVLDDPRLADAILSEWSSRSEREVSVRPLTAAELFTDVAEPPSCDVLVYPTPLLGELVRRQWIAPIPPERLTDPTYEFRDILDTVRSREIAWGEQVWGLSFGSPSFVLYYRKDIFERLGLKPPVDWGEYQTIARRLSDRNQLADIPHLAEKWSGTLEPLGSRWAAVVCLARAAAYARHPSSYSTLFDYRTMEPLIDQPSFARALHELRLARADMPDDVDSLEPTDVRDRFYRGEAAMAITWPGSRPLPEGHDVEVVAATGLSRLPGASDVFNFRTRAWEHRAGTAEYVPLLGIAGRIGSVTRTSRQPVAATRLLMWFTGPELGSQVSRASYFTGPSRQNHLSNVSNWLDPGLPRSAVQEFLDLVQRNQSAPSWLVVPAIPGSDEYLSALDQSVRTAGPELSDAEASLKKVAEQWREITARYGIDSQQHAYARSLGL